MLAMFATLITLSMAAPSHHQHGGGHDLGGIQTADPNNPDPGFNGPSGGGNLGGIQIVDPNNPDPGFNGPHHG